MTRQDYIAIADALRKLRERRQARLDVADYDREWHEGIIQGIDLAAFALTFVFEADNPRFDRSRFFAAVGKDLDS